MSTATLTVASTVHILDNTNHTNTGIPLHIVKFNSFFIQLFHFVFQNVTLPSSLSSFLNWKLRRKKPQSLLLKANCVSLRIEKLCQAFLGFTNSVLCIPLKLKLEPAYKTLRYETNQFVFPKLNFLSNTLPPKKWFFKIHIGFISEIHCTNTNTDTRTKKNMHVFFYVSLVTCNLFNVSNI